jgi:hypothetical protein
MRFFAAGLLIVSRQITQQASNWPFLFSAVPGRPGLVKNVPAADLRTGQPKPRRVRIQKDEEQVSPVKRARVRPLPVGMRGASDALF